MNDLIHAMELEGAMQNHTGLNYCIWCQSSYAAAPVPDANDRQKNDIRSMQSYRKKRFKLLLEYLLHKDTVHHSPGKHNEDQQRRHHLIQKVLELHESEEAGGESGTLYRLCPTCEGKADEVMMLHLELEVVQMKLVDKISCLTDAIITNSMCGSNEEARNRMQEMELWLQQEHDSVDEGIMGEVRRLKNYVDTLMQFQTLIIEGGSKPKSVPCVYLQKCMPISSFAGDDTSIVNWNFITSSTSILPTTSITWDSLSVSTSNCEAVSSHAPITTASEGVINNKISKRKLNPRAKSKCRKKVGNFNLDTTTGKYKCLICSKEFSGYSGFYQHYHSIHLNRQYKCDTCGMTFSRRQIYIEHNQSAHMGARFKCNGCEKIFTQKNSLVQHQRRTGCGKEHGFSSVSVSEMSPPKVKSECNATDETCSPADSADEVPEEYHDPDVSNKDGETPAQTSKTKMKIQVPNIDVSMDTGADVVKAGPVKDSQETNDKPSRRLRASHRCVKCQKIFPSLDKLIKHKQCHEKEELSDSDRSEPEDASAFEISDADPGSGSDSDLIPTTIATTPSSSKAPRVTPVKKSTFKNASSFKPARKKPNFRQKRINKRLRTKTKTDSTLEIPKISRNPETGRLHCPLCPSNYKKSFGFQGHYTSIHLRIRFDCSECGVRFASKQYLNLHREKFHLGVIGNNAKRYRCSVCKKSFSLKQIVERHQRDNVNCGTGQAIELPVRPYRPKQVLKIPRITVNPETGRFNCPDCSEDFSTLLRYKLHYQTIHLKITYDCSECGKVYKKKYHLKIHRQSVHLGVRYGCEICNKSFSQKKDLIIHHRTTICGAGKNLKPVVPPPKSICDLCGMEFTRVGNLRTHMRSVHEGNRKHQCEHCGMSFSRHSSCVNHTQAVHLGVRFDCEVCKKSFSQKGAKTAHQRWSSCGTALGLGPTPKQNCKICGKEFEGEDILGQHMRQDHRERPHPCEVCGKRFRTEHCVNVHNNKVHLGLKQNQYIRNKPKKKLNPSPNEAIGSPPLDLKVEQEGVYL